MLYKLRSVYYILPILEKYFPKQEFGLQNAETCVVLKDVGKEDNSNNYESHEN
jgi:hypothetical protein